MKETRFWRACLKVIVALCLIGWVVVTILEEKDKSANVYLVEQYQKISPARAEAMRADIRRDHDAAGWTRMGCLACAVIAVAGLAVPLRVER